MKSVYYVTFRSVTLAQRGERILWGAGVRCALQRTPKWMESQGCGYALRLWTEDIGRAVALLHRERLPLRRVYQRRPDATLEELTL